MPPRRAPSDAPIAQGACWDLRELYAGPADPRLATDTAVARAQAERFAVTWRGTIAAGALDASALRAALVEYEAIWELGQRPGFYASLVAAADSQDPVTLDLEQRTTEQQAELRTLLVFFELELAALLARLGIDISAPAFGDGGCATIAAMVEELKRSGSGRR